MIMNNTISIVAIILFITLCLTLYVYFDLASKIQQFQRDRLRHIMNLENEIKIQSENLLERQVCSENLQNCSSQLDKNNKVISEIRNALHYDINNN
jgi:hypothetical protein